MKKWEILEEGMKKLGGAGSGHRGHQGGSGGPGNPGGSRASGGGGAVGGGSASDVGEKISGESTPSTGKVALDYHNELMRDLDARDDYGRGPRLMGSSMYSTLSTTLSVDKVADKLLLKGYTEKSPQGDERNFSRARSRVSVIQKEGRTRLYVYEDNLTGYKGQRSIPPGV